MAANSTAKCFIVIPAFIPLIGTKDYIVDYVKRIKNGKKMRDYSEDFDRLTTLISIPDLMSEEIVFDILHRICVDFKPGSENNSTMWNIFNDVEKVLQMTALMTRLTSSSLSAKIASSGGYRLSSSSSLINKTSMVHLNMLLSYVWQPVVLEFNKTKGNPSAQLETLKNISLDIFNQIRDGSIQQKRRMKTFTVWRIRPQYRAWALLAVDNSSPTIPFSLKPTTWKEFEINVITVCLHVMEYFELFTAKDGSNSDVSADSDPASPQSDDSLQHEYKDSLAFESIEMHDDSTDLDSPRPHSEESMYRLHRKDEDPLAVSETYYELTERYVYRSDGLYRTDRFVLEIEPMEAKKKFNELFKIDLPNPVPHGSAVRAVILMGANGSIPLNR